MEGRPRSFDTFVSVAVKYSVLRYNHLRDKTSNVAKHDICADGSRARGIGQDVRRDLGVAQSTKGEGACGDEERRAVADLRVFGGEEHDVPDHHEGGGADEEDLAFVEACGEVGEQDGEEGADYVGWHGAELLVYYRVDGRRVDRLCGTVSWLVFGKLSFQFQQLTRTIVGKKKAKPWTVMLSSKKMNEVPSTTGLKMPASNFFLSILSRTSVVPTRSDLMRAIANSFSSAVNHFADDGRSVSVKKAISDKPQVIIPSMMNIMRHVVRLPTLSRVRIPEASRPPKAPARGAITMYSDRRKASSLRRYQRDI